MLSCRAFSFCISASASALSLLPCNLSLSPSGSSMLAFPFSALSSDIYEPKISHIEPRKMIAAPGITSRYFFIFCLSAADFDSNQSLIFVFNS